VKPKRKISNTEAVKKLFKYRGKRGKKREGWKTRSRDRQQEDVEKDLPRGEENRMTGR